MEKVLKKKNPGARLHSPKIVRLYPGKKPAPVSIKAASKPSPPVFPVMQMPPQPEAYLKASEFDFF
jgi:hypothetical protein